MEVAELCNQTPNELNYVPNDEAPFWCIVQLDDTRIKYTSVKALEETKRKQCNPKSPQCQYIPITRASDEDPQCTPWSWPRMSQLPFRRVDGGRTWERGTSSVEVSEVYIEGYITSLRDLPVGFLLFRWWQQVFLLSHVDRGQLD